MAPAAATLLAVVAARINGAGSSNGGGICCLARAGTAAVLADSDREGAMEWLLQAAAAPGITTYRVEKL